MSQVSEYKDLAQNYFQKSFMLIFWPIFYPKRLRCSKHSTKNKSFLENILISVFILNLETIKYKIYDNRLISDLENNLIKLDSE